MGKGDRKTRRGKIYRGSHGNARPHSPVTPAVANSKPTVRKSATATATATAARRAPRKAAPRKKAT